MKKMRRWLSLVLCLVMAVSMSACGGSEGSNTNDNGGTNDGNNTKTGRILTMGVSGTPNIDPAISLSNSDLASVINMYDTLVVPSEDGVENRVADSWEVSEDGLTYTFKIKEGIKFHNGSEMTASDVAFSMNRILDIGEGISYIYSDVVESTEATDDTTVVFHMKKPFGPFINSLIRLCILDEEEVMENKKDGVYGENGDYGRNYLLTHDAGSGAYMAKELVQQDYFLAEKNPDWFMGWDNKNAPDGFKMMAITEAATVRTMIQNGTLDFTDQWQSPENLKEMSKMEGISIAEYSTCLIYNMYLNTKLAPLDDVNVRKAICSLIDYDTICNNILVDSVKTIGPVMSKIAGATETNVYTYNIENAKKYIAASKYADTIGDYTIEILCNSDVVSLEKIALMLQAVGTEIGLKFEISKAPWVSIVDRTGSFDTTPHMLAISSGPKYNDAGCYLEARYHTKNSGTWEQGEWIANEDLDKKIDDALATVDDNERYAKYAEIQNYIVDELCPTSYMCEYTERVAYNSNHVKWNFIENAKEGEIPWTLDGYSHVFSEMELID